MFTYFTDIKNKRKKRFLVVNNRGFITIYGIILLNAVLVFEGMLINKMNAMSYYKQNNIDLWYAELYVIHTVKEELLNYEEEDREFTYLDFTIQLEYDDIVCIYTIEKNGIVLLRARLEFDDINEEYVSYEYLSI